MTYLAALSLSKGARTGFAAVAGIALGLLTYGVIAAFGLAADRQLSTAVRAVALGRRDLSAVARLGKLGRRGRRLPRGGQRRQSTALACLPTRLDHQPAQSK